MNAGRHVYPAPGTYTATIRVADPLYEVATSSQTMTVSRGAMHVDCRLRPQNCRGRLERDAEHEFLAIADAALDATAAIRAGVNTARAGFEEIVVFATAQAGTGESTANLEALRGRQ